MPTKERFRFINGYDKGYKISNFGYILSSKTHNGSPSKKWRPKIGQVNSNGYYIVHLFQNNKSKPFGMHKLVCEYFLPNPNNYTQNNHLDKNKLNNHVDNLEWVSRRENNTHSFITRKKKSKYMGVIWVKLKNRWKAVISINKVGFYLGHYKTEEEAHTAYLFAMVLYGIENKYATHLCIA